MILISIGVWGTLSDKIGRRFVFAAGFLIMAIALLLYPGVTSVPALFLSRGLFALGSSAATTMLATVIADYAINEDRGKASGIQGVGNGIGALLTVFVVLQLPKIFIGRGATPDEAGQYTFWLMAGAAIFTAVLLGLGLQKRTRIQKEQHKSILQISREGISAAKYPGVALAYMAAFISRGDMAIVGTFFTLWIVTFGTAQAGLTTADALAQRRDDHWYLASHGIDLCTGIWDFSRPHEPGKCDNFSCGISVAGLWLDFISQRSD